jgi:peptidoglycan/xylan/chitin deacetylase (PgdA/CDA1 family)
MRVGGLPTLTYHAIDSTCSPISTDPVRFAETMAALHEAGYRTVDLPSWIAQGRPCLPRRFALTFDDGLRSLLKVWDIFDRYKLHATLFVVTDHVGRDNAWAGQPAGVPVSPTLSWQELSEVVADRCTIGSHTVSHPVLTRLDDARIQYEMSSSRGEIESRLGCPSHLFAYPYGVSSVRVTKAAESVYSAAFTTRIGYADSGANLFELPRIDAFDLRTDANVGRLLAGTLHRHLIVRGAVRSARRALLTGSSL